MIRFTYSLAIFLYALAMAEAWDWADRRVDFQRRVTEQARIDLAHHMEARP